MILTAILNYDAQSYLQSVQHLKDAIETRNDVEVLAALVESREMFLQLPLYNAYLGGMGMLDIYLGMPQFIDDSCNELQFLEPLCFAAEAIPAIRKRHTWFLSEALDDGGQRRKKGQRKIPLVDRIRMNWRDAYVSSISLGNEIWPIHQRAYRKYYAHLMKKQMTRQEFFTWAEAASNLRDELIPKYDAAEPEERAEIARIYQKEINQR